MDQYRLDGEDGSPLKRSTKVPALPGRWLEPDYELLRSKLDRGTIADAADVPLSFAERILLRTAHPLGRTKNNLTALSVAVHHYSLLNNRQPELWVHESVDGTTIVEEIRAHELDSDEYIRHRLAQEALTMDAPEFDLWLNATAASNLGVPTTAPLDRSLLPERPFPAAGVFSLVRPALEVFRRSLVISTDRATELQSSDFRIATRREAAQLEILADAAWTFCFDTLSGASDGDIDSWFLQEDQNKVSLADRLYEHETTWVTDVQEARPAD